MEILNSYCMPFLVEQRNVDIADFRKFEKLSIKEDKAALDLSFLRNCQSLNVFPKFVCFNHRWPKLDI